MTDEDLIREIDAQRLLMISVSTGGASIESKNSEYAERRDRIKDGLLERHIADPNPYEDLWAWRSKWSSGDLPKWQDRREYVSSLYRPLVEAVVSGSSAAVFTEPTGWLRVDRTLDEIRSRLGGAKTEEQFQALGLLCREALITLSQVVHDPERHPSLDGVVPSDTDAKRKLEAYLNAELAGDSNKAARGHAKAALALANDLQHSRTATHRDAALCAEATTSVVNIVAVISGKRDRHRPGTPDEVAALADRVEAAMRRVQTANAAALAFHAAAVAVQLGLSPPEVMPALRYLEQERRIYYDSTTGLYSLSPMPWNRQGQGDRMF